MDRPPHLDIDLNEAPSPPPSPAAVPQSPPREYAPPIFAPLPPLPPPPQILPPPPPPANSQAQLLLAHEAREIALRLNQAESLRVAAARALAAAAAAAGSPAGVPQPAQHPGEAGWGHPGHPPLPCASCGRPEIPGATIVCDACERGFHESCVRVLPPLMSLPPPPPPGPPGVRRPPVAVNEDWMCPECEMHGARSTRWRLGPVPLDINAAPPEDPVTVAVRDITRVSVADGAHLTELPHFEGLHLKNTTLFDGNHFMPAFGLAHCLSIRQQFAPTGRDFIADGNVEQRSNHIRRRKRDFPQTSTLPKFAEKPEFGTPNIFMDPSFLTKATELSSTEERNPLKPPKYIVDGTNRRPDHRSVGLPVQYGDFFITSLGEIDKRASYHNCHQIWPVGFTSYWHDRITGSLFECEVHDGGSFGPLFKVRRLPCSAFPLPEAPTILSQNAVRKADTPETKESSSFIGDTVNDTYDNMIMLLSDPSETNQDFLSCLTNDTEYKRTSLGCNDAQNSNTMAQILLSCSVNSWAPGKEANFNDHIGEFTFEGTSSSSVWRMISCAMMEACEKMYKEHGALVFLCSHSSEKPSLNKGIGCQNFDGPCAPLTRFCSSSGPNIPRVVEKKNDVESTYKLLKEWLYQDRIGLDLEFVQEIVETLPRSRACLNYQFLCNRAEFVSSMTVASGSLTVVHRDGQSNGGMSYGRHGSAATGLQDNAKPSGSSIRELPPGRPISHKLPPELVGDVFQIWEFLGRFAEIIGLKEVPSYEQLEDELIDPWPIGANQKEVLSVSTQHYRDHSSPMNFPANGSISHSNGESGLTNNEDIVSVFVPVETPFTKEATQDALAAQTLGRCSGVVLPGVHLTLFKVLLGELLSKVAIFVDPNIDPKESKPRRGRKRDTENLISTKELNFDMLTANKLTWPELARRYMLAVSSISGCMDLSDISSREGVKLFRCLQGDGGILCGALPGVAGMEKDALLLLEAENLLCSSPSNGEKVFMMDYKDTDMIDSAEVSIADNRTLPDWAEPLEPVRKLPTNVGTRIRKCVYEALERKPPEWARKILEHAISKEVYKGNASGPTKKAVLSVLAEACRVIVPQKAENPRKERKTISFSDAILRKCRIALRSAISSDESKLFGNLLGTTLMNSNENEDDGILGFPGMVSRPLDFRTIDIRLAMGAYCGSWETFSEDVQEVIRNLHIAFADRTDVVEMVVALSQSFESLYKTEVLDLVEKFDHYLSNGNAGSEIHEELHGILTATTSLPKAPWEDGVCKVCGIDRDDDSVLLCDKCDSEYHTYCLNPPLARIPQGNWYCPSCTSDQNSHLDQGVQDLKQGKKHLGEESHAFHEVLGRLAAAMEEKEYWELSPQERINLLKFLCDEMLNTALIRDHIDQCADKLNDLQQKFRSLNFELKDLKYKEEIRTSYARQSRWSKTEQHFNNSSGLVENQQNDVAIASGHLEEVERGNTGVNLNHPVEGAPPGQLSAGKSGKSDNDISMVEDHKSLGFSEQPSGTANEIEVIIIDEGSQSSREKLLGGKSSTCDNFNSSDTPIAERAPVASPLSTPGAELTDENASTSFQDNLKTSTTGSLEHAADNDEMDTLSDEISKLQDSIGIVESQLNMASLRRDCLGKDSLGRFYWVLGRPGKHPLLIADGSMLVRKERDITMINSYPLPTFDCKGWNSASIVIYESDEEIQGLVGWLREYDPKEKELKDSIMQWQRHLQGSFLLSDPSVPKLSKSEQFMDLPNTKAAVILEQKYGLQLNQDMGDLSRRRGRKTKLDSGERAYRCDCLEPIWPARHHCLTCHETYFTSTEYEGHNAGKCNIDIHSPSGSKENDEPKVKGPKSDTKEKDSIAVESSSSTKLKSCPYDFEEICRKFVTNDSNKEIVNGIGLIGSNGVPSFVPSPAFFLEPAVILNKNKQDGIANDLTSSLEECQEMSAQRLGQEGSKSGQNCSSNTGDEHVSKSGKPTPDSTCEEASSATDKPIRLLAVNGGLVPESSLRPVIGRNTHILKQQKINLIDIEAALPEEALRASKSQQTRRRSWRAFVKDAESISEMVLATSLLESMIKAEFLKNDWWYWSSFTVAMKTSTVSSLALRIYTLDDSIIYSKDPNVEPADSTKVVNKGRRRKEPEPSAS